jgi:pilus assembly protein Flp/PilA
MGRLFASDSEDSLSITTLPSQPKGALLHHISSMIRDEEGDTMVEYGLLVALIALVALIGVTMLGHKLHGVYTRSAGSVW